MKRTAIASMLVALIAASSAAHIENAKIVPAAWSALPADGWIAYELPSDGRFTMCCFEFLAKHLTASMTCRLGRGNSSFGQRMDASRKIDTSAMVVALRREAGVIRDVEVYSSGCPVDAGGATVHFVDRVSVDDSLDLLQRAVNADRHDDNAALQAVAMHQSPRIADMLERWASERGDDDFRGQALFWYAQVGGKRGFDFIRRIANDDPDREVRKKAIFALTQSSEAGVFDALASIATKHSDAETRSEGVFWLGQEAQEKALPILRDVVANDPSWEVREKAIFAIGQVPGDQAAQLLVKLARDDRDPEVRKNALFWLGQAADRKLSVLREAADRDPDSDVREMAVFAISQRPADEAIPQLIQLARTHRDIAVRKKAIFWLSQMDDPRAVSAIEQLLLHSDGAREASHKR